jgi:hypothetical protein
MYEQGGFCRYSLGSSISFHLTFAAREKLPVRLQFKVFPNLNPGKGLE